MLKYNYITNEKSKYHDYKQIYLITISSKMKNKIKLHNKLHFKNITKLKLYFIDIIKLKINYQISTLSIRTIKNMITYDDTLCMVFVIILVRVGSC